MASDPTDDVQKQTRDMLRAQQETFLTAVRAWREALAAGAAAGVQPPPWPQSTAPGTVPTAAEVAEASYAFAAKLLADQSLFMEELSKAMTDPVKKA